jgi:hypothetical protein
VGSIPITRSSECAHVAQLVEHVLGKDEVTGSIPVVGSKDSAGVRSRQGGTESEVLQTLRMRAP